MVQGLIAVWNSCVLRAIYSAGFQGLTHGPPVGNSPATFRLIRVIRLVPW